MCKLVLSEKNRTSSNSSISLKWIVGLLSRTALLLVVTFFMSVSFAYGSGNSVNAYLCKSDLSNIYSSTTGASFSNRGDCVSFGAQGGVLSSIKISSTQADPSGQVFRVTIQGFGLQPGTGAIVYFKPSNTSQWGNINTALISDAAHPAVVTDADGNIQGTPAIELSCGFGYQFYVTATSAVGVTIPAANPPATLVSSPCN